MAIAALTAAMLFMPLATIQLDGLLYSLDTSGLNTMTTPSELVYSAWALMALPAVISIAALTAIFLYKKRIKQIRICVFNAILLIGFYGLFAFILWKIFGLAGDFRVSNVRIALTFPLISLILSYLAIRSIGADEMLVKSLDRLRK